VAWLDGSQRGRRLKEDVGAGRTVVGTFLNMGSPLAAEACAIAGFDWLLVDLEHGGRGEDGLLGQILAGAAHDVPVIVRVETTDRIRSGRVLDLGANGIMFPRVNGTNDAVAAAANLRYPPDGWRGVATYNRSCGFGSHPEVLDSAANSVVCVIQVETLGALEDIHGIASVPGVDVLFVGPRDLTQALGCPGQTSSAVFLDALETVVKASKDAGVSAGVLASRPEDVQPYSERGFTFIGVGSDSSMLASTANAVASSATKGPSGTHRPSSSVDEPR
jgi:2-keto-3-deoxy-L-rhamnonate aldolase RhmA